MISTCAPSAFQSSARMLSWRSVAKTWPVSPQIAVAKRSPVAVWTSVPSGPRFQPACASKLMASLGSWITEASAHDEPIVC